MVLFIINFICIIFFIILILLNKIMMLNYIYYLFKRLNKCDNSVKTVRSLHNVYYRLIYFIFE